MHPFSAYAVLVRSSSVSAVLMYVVSVSTVLVCILFDMYCFNAHPSVRILLGMYRSGRHLLGLSRLIVRNLEVSGNIYPLSFHIGYSN